MLWFRDQVTNMVIKSEAHTTFQNFSKDGQQRNRSVILGWLYTFLFMNGNDSGFPLRWNMTSMQRMVEQFNSWLCNRIFCLVCWHYWYSVLWILKLSILIINVSGIFYSLSTDFLKSLNVCDLGPSVCLLYLDIVTCKCYSNCSTNCSTLRALHTSTHNKASVNAWPCRRLVYYTYATSVF